MEKDKKNFGLLEETSIETVKEEIREFRNKQEQEKNLKNKHAKICCLVLSLIFALWTLSLVLIVILQHIFYFPKETVSLMIVIASIVFALSSFLIPKIFLHEPNQQLWINENELRKQLNEIILGGKIVVGRVNEEWSEITIDKGNYMSKIMARLVGEEKLDIETRSIILE